MIRQGHSRKCSSLSQPPKDRISGKPQSAGDTCTLIVRARQKLLQPMSTEATLMQLANTVTEKKLGLRAILLTHADRKQEYHRTETAAGEVETQKIEVSVSAGHTRLAILFTIGAGEFSPGVKSELLEAVNLAAKRIELCERIIGTSLPMIRLKETIELAAACDSTTLITGPSGTGKELVARAIHDLSARAGQSFVSINCGALTETLLESELFGYVRGAFTGATSAKKGLFEVAHCGTLFLDEFGETSPQMQVKLLRVLQERQVRPVGATDREIAVNVRVVVATNKNLVEEVRAGRFRQDLYYRVNVLQAETPPLGERRVDIPALAEHLLGRVYKRAGLTSPAKIESDAVLLLSEYSWPGNVREMENVMERLSVGASRDESIVAGRGVTITTKQVRTVLATFGFYTAGKGATPRVTAINSADYIMRDQMEAALSITGGNQARAGRLLGMKRSAFHRLHKRVQQRVSASSSSVNDAFNAMEG